MSDLKAMIQSLFPAEVYTVCTTEAGAVEHLFPQEQAMIRGAVPKRRNEFAAGRLAARKALAQLGVSDFPLLARPDRAPIWPEGIVGSISHCLGLCAVAVAREQQVAGLGLDVETAEPLPRDLFGQILNASEARALSNLPDLDAQRAAKVIFVAKESVFKAVYPLTGTWIEFDECTVHLQPDESAFTAFVSAPLLPAAWRARAIHGRLIRSGPHVAAGVTVRSQTPSSR